MGKNKRKKKQKEADFKKVKLKVGKRLPKGTNETRTSFKSQGIVVPSQDLVKEGQLTNVKKQSLKDLISHLNHYSATVRKDALVGLRSLFQQHLSVFQDNLSLVLSSIADKMTDTDSDVRHALLLLLQFILPQLPNNQASPFLPLLVAHLSSAMTHIYEDIQLESLGFLSLFLKLYPKQLTASSKQLLDNFIGLISQHSGGSANTKSPKGSTKIVINPKGQLASPKARLKILSQLYDFLKSTYNTETDRADNLDSDENPSTQFNQVRQTYIPVFSESAKEPNFQLFSLQSHTVSVKNLGADSLQEASGDVKEFLQKIVPLLLEFWVECSPSQLSTSLLDNTLLPVNRSILSTIMNILKVLLRAFFHKDSSDLERSEFASSYFKDFNTHFMRLFPFQERLQSTPKTKSKSPEASDNSSTLMLNISVCEVMSFFVSIPLNLPRHSATVSWTGIIEEFIMDTLELSSKNKLNAEQLNGLLIYVEKVLQQRVHEDQSDSSTMLLSSLYKLYQSSHLLSAIKIVLLKFFVALFLKDQKLQSRSQVQVPWQSLMNQWVRTLPKLLIQLQTSSPDNTSIVIKVLSTLLKQNPDAVDSNEIQNQLTSFLDPAAGPFCKLTTQIQKSVFELIFSLPVVSSDLLQILALCCHQTNVPIAVVQYLIHILQYRSSASCGLLDRTPVITMSSYLSFLFSIAIGFSKKELIILQSANEGQLNLYNISLVKSGTEMKNIWQRNQDILKVVCVMYSQLQNPKDLLSLMEPAIGKLLKEIRTLPITVAGSILKLYKCYLHLYSASSTIAHHVSSLPASFVESIAELSLSCILYSIKEDSTHDAEIMQCLYNDVMDVFAAQPFVLEKLLCVLLERVIGPKHQTTIITTKLLQSLSHCSMPCLYSASIAELVNGLIEKIRAKEPTGQHISYLDYQYSLYVVEYKRRKKSDLKDC